MKSICVFLGAREGSNPAVKQAAIELGAEIARRKITLVYGGSGLGLMGDLAISAKQEGGTVIGIMPRGLMDIEEPLKTMDEFLIVDTIAERKHLMLQKSDGFIAIPGGLGTLEEIFETWSAMRLGLLGSKPFGFLNVEGYYDQLFAFVETCERFGFVPREHRMLPKIHADVPSLLADLVKG
ncbi:LOG family protein [Legionella sp. CNM-4043-24]|uniref:LOG family protein n=1 Tax=Legionella sp. CNM-4043-24 TaxID=3421646 RepID=UPI00403ACE2C